MIDAYIAPMTSRSATHGSRFLLVLTRSDEKGMAQSRARAKMKREATTTAAISWVNTRMTIMSEIVICVGSFRSRMIERGSWPVSFYPCGVTH